MATPPFENNFSGILCGLSLGACVPNLNSVSLATLEAAKFHQNRLKNCDRESVDTHTYIHR